MRISHEAICAVRSSDLPNPRAWNFRSMAFAYASLITQTGFPQAWDTVVSQENEGIHGYCFTRDT